MNGIVYTEPVAKHEISIPFSAPWLVEPSPLVAHAGLHGTSMGFKYLVSILAASPLISCETYILVFVVALLV